MTDVAIIGGGAAGLSAAIYAARAGLSVCVADAAGGGGQLWEIAEIENYFGIECATGGRIAADAIKQAKAAGARLITAHVTEVRRVGLGFEVTCAEGGEERRFGARTLILANGASPRRLGVAGETEFTGRGVSYCGLCDGRFFVGKRVAVVGGGNGALSEALYLSRVAAVVHIICRGRALKGERAVLERLQALPAVVIHTNTRVHAIDGADRVSALMLCEAGRETLQRLCVDGVFVAIGREPQNGAFANLFPLDEKGYVMTDENCACARDGLFAAGDTRRTTVRQLITAAADGACAAEAARRYLLKRDFVPLGRIR